MKKTEFSQAVSGVNLELVKQPLRFEHAASQKITWQSSTTNKEGALYEIKEISLIIDKAI
ncbi:hypothetical protein [Rahnella contaminans]|uniref:hypothetical protein n=1 Tax=Rahnella contaminans TaxID=2703882 RepID=UPI0023DA3A50|nr:hypothetical protein [Rahnella contaminans]MDF1895553.1 hypothetical protein [Rahnella contaminans]